MPLRYEKITLYVCETHFGSINLHSSINFLKTILDDVWTNCAKTVTFDLQELQLMTLHHVIVSDSNFNTNEKKEFINELYTILKRKKKCLFWILPRYS